jgi:hypothetical protein
MSRAVDVALRDIRTARQYHAEWAEAQAAGDPWVLEEEVRTEVAGDEEWHRLWMKRYDRVLRLLESLR